MGICASEAPEVSASPVRTLVTKKLISWLEPQAVSPITVTKPATATRAMCRFMRAPPVVLTRRASS